MEKKRFLLFGYDGYYPRGGMTDCIATFETLDELIAMEFYNDYYNVFDTKHFKVGRGNSPTKAFSDLSSD